MTRPNPYLLHPDSGLMLDAEADSYTWKPLTFLNTYRFLISFVLVILTYSNALIPPLGSADRTLFFATSLGYLASCLMFALLLHARRPRFTLQASLQLVTDIIATILLMHASGGVSSGLGNLLIITVAGGSVVLSGRHAMLFTSVAALAVLGEQAYSEYFDLSRESTYTQAGLLGLTLFVTAVVAHLFARRIRETEALAKERGVDLANMAELTEHVLQRMQTGIVVVDGDNRLRLINESAWYMLGMPSTAGSPPLEELSLPLARELLRWKANPEYRARIIQPSADHANITPRFARLSQEENPATLIFLEDSSAMAQRAQQLQLASLGRLTASIAHEIRNPLGAISHAGQLLAESPNMDQHDSRLTRIITEQSRRMNTIIESVMQLGRRSNTRPELIQLRPFLQKFLRDFLTARKVPAGDVGLHIEPEDVQIRFDITHLQQILANLLENALRHSRDVTTRPRVELRGGLSLDLNRPYLEVIDYGSGIDSDAVSHIFEPFYSTHSQGSGLGLYISRELAEANQAHLNYIPLASGGSCFRLSFQDPRRHMH